MQIIGLQTFKRQRATPVIVTDSQAKCGGEQKTIKWYT